MSSVDRKIAHFALDPAEVAPVATGDDTFLQNFVEHLIRKGLLLAGRIAPYTTILRRITRTDWETSVGQDLHRLSGLLRASVHEWRS